QAWATRLGLLLLLLRCTGSWFEGKSERRAILSQSNNINGYAKPVAIRQLDRCRVCGAEEFIPYVCRYCGGAHCVLHRLPENHECPNIQQARAPRPYIRSERKGAMRTLRPLSVPRLAKFSTISGRELSSLLVAWVVLGVSFSISYLFNGVSPIDFVIIFPLTLVLVGTGFIGHDLAHT